MPTSKGPTFEDRKAIYAALWDSATIEPDHAPELRSIARRILLARPRYDPVSKATGVPWYVIGIIHSMECSLSFDKHLHNGDPLVGKDGLPAKTRRKPQGRGPFSTWEESAIDALRYDDLHKVRDWSVERIAFMLETFNGFGYIRHGVPSPYLWSYTDKYERGKYKSDGQWEPLLVSKQAGGMAILKMLMEMDPTQIDLDVRPHIAEPVGQGFPKAPTPVPAPVAQEAMQSKSGWLILVSGVLWVISKVQEALAFIHNAFGAFFGSIIDAADAGMKMLPLVATDVDSALTPIRSLGRMAGANIDTLLSGVAVILMLVAWARHIRDRRERNHLKAMLPEGATGTQPQAAST